MARRFIDEVDDALNYARETRLSRDAEKEPRVLPRRVTREDHLERAVIAAGLVGCADPDDEGGAS